MRRYRTVIVIVLMGVVPMVAAVFVMRFILPSDRVEPIQAPPPVQQAAPAPPPVVEEEPKEVMVLGAAQALPVGTLLADEHLREVGIEDGLVRRWHIETENLGYDEMPYGYVVREAIPAGGPVRWPSLVGPRQRGFLAAVLKPGMRAITVRLGAGTRHSGLVDPGDRVDVVLTAQSRERGEQNALARTILEDVRVVAVDRRIASAAGSQDGSGEVERAEIATATLEVLPSQTGLLALGELEGELSLAVRALAATGATPEPIDVVDMQSLPGASTGEPAAEDSPDRAGQRGQRCDVRGRPATRIVFEYCHGEERPGAGTGARDRAHCRDGPDRCRPAARGVDRPQEASGRQGRTGG